MLICFTNEFEVSGTSRLRLQIRMQHVKMFTSRAQNLIFCRSWNCDILALRILKAVKFSELNRVSYPSLSDVHRPRAHAKAINRYPYLPATYPPIFDMKIHCLFRTLSTIFWTGFSYLDLHQNLCFLCNCSGMKFSLFLSSSSLSTALWTLAAFSVS
jgi:hypothetical protein